MSGSTAPGCNPMVYGWLRQHLRFAGFSLLTSSHRIYLPNKMSAAMMDATRKLMALQGLNPPALPVGLGPDHPAL